MKNPVLWFLTIGTALSGCAELNSIHRVHRASDNGPEIVTVDAKQRHLIIGKETMSRIVGTETVLTTNWRTCAEAAPDVFSAYAASGAAKGSKSGGQLSFGGAETAATIERTQTINLLRESFYRTCERYLSGAIGKTQFIVQAARDQRSMVAVLAIEQLTRTTRPPSTIISGPQTEAAIRDGEAAAKLVEQFRKDADATAVAFATARTEFDTANGTGKCKDNDKPPEGDDEAAIAARAAHAKCVEAKIKLATREAENKQAQDRLDKVLALAANAVSNITASTSKGETNSGQGGAPASAEAISAVASAVTKIALGTGFDESLMFCIAYLTENSKLPNSSNKVTDSCVKILEERAAADNNERIQMFSNDESGKIISDYLDEPSEPRERARRRQVAQQAATNIGISNNIIDLINFVATASPTEKLKLLEAMLGVETDASGKAALAAR